MPLVRLHCDVCNKSIEPGQEAVRVSVGTAGLQITSLFMRRNGISVAHKDCLNIQAEDDSQYAVRVLQQVSASSSLQTRVSQLEDEVDDFEGFLERQIKINDEVLDMLDSDSVRCGICGQVDCPLHKGESQRE